MNQHRASITEYVSVTEFIKRHPMFLKLQELTEWDDSDVGDKFHYPQSVHESQLYRFNGVFMELFMRKCVCKKYAIQCTDGCTEAELRFLFRAESIKQRLFEAYTAYIDPQRDAVDIIDEIRMVALSHRLAYEENLENVHDAMSMEIDICNLKEIVKFVDNLEFERVVYKEPFEMTCANIHLFGVPDYVFDDAVICHVSTSMRHEVYPSKVLQMILYQLCHYCQNYYRQNLERQYTLIIYNPLLGKKYTLGATITPLGFKNVQRVIEEGVTATSS